MTPISLNIDNIFVINLKNQEYKFLETLKFLQKIKLSQLVSRFEAYDKDDAKNFKYEILDPRVENNIKDLKSTKIIPTWGAVGCAKSHIKLWEMIANGKQGVLSFVMEDDNLLYDEQSFLYNIHRCFNIYKSTNNNFNIPFFATFDSTCSYKSRSLNIPYYNIYSEIRGTSCYLINSSCAHYLLDNIYPLYHQIDIKMGLVLSKMKSAMPKCECLLIPNSGIKQSKKYESTVQYYFINIDVLHSIFKNLPMKIIQRIHYFLPKKSEFSENQLYNNSYHSHLIYGDYNTTIY